MPKTSILNRVKWVCPFHQSSIESAIATGPLEAKKCAFLNLKKPPFRWFGHAPKDIRERFVDETRDWYKSLF